MNYKSAIESLWTGKMTVIVRKQIKNDITKKMEFIEQSIYNDLPCRLSFSNISTTENNIGAAEKTQEIKVFCDSLKDIPAGCKIRITQNNRTTEYTQSGEPAYYTNHQEIPLKLFERWA